MALYYMYRVIHSKWTFLHPLISVVDGLILKSFGVVIVITGWFGV